MPVHSLQRAGCHGRWMPCDSPTTIGWIVASMRPGFHPRTDAIGPEKTVPEVSPSRVRAHGCVTLTRGKEVTGGPADSPHAISSLRHPKAHAFIGCSLTGIALPADPLPSGRILSVLRRR